jgi:hypothetical protein
MLLKEKYDDAVEEVDYKIFLKRKARMMQSRKWTTRCFQRKKARTTQSKRWTAGCF